MKSATTSNPAPQTMTLAPPENGTLPADVKFDGMTPDERAARIASMGGKPKRARKARSKPVVATKPPKERKPRRSLLARIEAMGHAHVLAYRALSAGDRTWAPALNHALGASQRVAEALRAKEAAAVALSQATTRHDTAILNRGEGAAFIKQLDDLARSIAIARGDVPHADDAPTEADFKGVEIPL